MFIDILKKRKMKIIEAHDALSAYIIDQTKYSADKGDIFEYDGIWISSLCDSIIRGKPDMEVVNITDRKG